MRTTLLSNSQKSWLFKVVSELPAGFFAGGAYSFLADDKWDCSLLDDNKPWKEKQKENNEYTTEHF